MMKSVIATLFTLLCAFSALADEIVESPQITTVRSINKLLAAGKFEEVYRDWCHPHIQEQVGKEEFVESMNEDFGKGVVRLFADVIKAIDDKSGPEVLVAQTQEDKDEYEFVLPQVRKDNPFGGKGNPWHIELKLHDGKWKLMDTD